MLLLHVTVVRIYEDRASDSYGQCAGSLIDETHIATAAHCVVDDYGFPYKPEQIDVFLGRVKAFSDRTKPNSVSKIWVDSKFDSDNLAHDFAILTLSKPVKYSQTIAPVCLPNNESGLSKLTVPGWGRTAAQADSSDNLLEVEVDYLTKKECEEVERDYVLNQNGYPESMRYLIPITGVVDTHLCAINKQTKGDACSGDSGGPIMHRGSNGRHYLMGVVSGSWTECGEDEDTAGLYTRTLYYKNVIQSIAPNACWQN